jgi:hypothetical protein
VRKKNPTTAKIRSSTRWARHLRLRGGALIVCVVALGALGGRDETSPDVVIHEVGWAGTQASSSDEWIELASNADRAVSLVGWRLEAEDGVPVVWLTGTAPAAGYFLLERSDDHTVNDIPADLVFTGTLENSGETLRLLDDKGRIMDIVDCSAGWFAGQSAPSYATMERVNPERPGTASNWRTHDGVTQTGHDAAGHPIHGTPKAANSATKPPRADFSAIPTEATIWDDVAFLDLSVDVDGEIVSWWWTFGDGAASDGRSVLHRFRVPGAHRATLTVEDSDGLAGQCERTIAVSIGRGDLNGDGQVDLIDVRMCLTLAIGSAAAAPTGHAADIDQDGDIDVEDAKRLAEFVLGL